MLDFSHLSLAIFLPACFAMNLTPGPSNMTAFFVGARHCWRTGAASVVGRLPAYACLIVLVAVGLGAALAVSGAALWWIKLFGAAYLIYLGVVIWRSPAPEPGEIQGDWRRLARREFAIAILNPKAIVIFTAFFPQFLQTAAPIAPQILAMGAAFLALELLAAWLYVATGRLTGDAMRRVGGFALLQKGVGGFLAVSGATLAASNR